MTIAAVLANDLRAALSADALVAAADALPAYGRDFWTLRGVPGVVVRAAGAADVVATLRFAAARGIAIVPRAAGTNVSAGFLPTPERILLDLRPMNEVLNIDIERERATVQPGVINGDLNALLVPRGYCFSPDPASAPISSIGGNIAENAGGPHCLKYGVTVHHIEAIECALIGGDVLRLAADDAGSDLLGLLIGSEGTLGIVTEATVRLRPLPAVTRTLLAAFDRAEDAVAAVSATIAAGIIPAAMEYFDRAAVAIFDAYQPTSYPKDADALLLIDLDGTAASVAAEIAALEPLLRRTARDVWRSDDDAERTALWRGRLQGAQAVVASGRGFYICDTTIPREHLPEMQRRVWEIGAWYALETLTVGHAGDGNVHPFLLYDKENPAQVAAMHAAAAAVADAALALGGTITGEHGIGSEKTGQMRQRFAPAEIAAMRAVKVAFDPDGLLNPGVLLPPADPDEPPLPRFIAALSDMLAARRADQRWTHDRDMFATAPSDTAQITVDAENLTVTAAAATPLAALHAALSACSFRCDLPVTAATVGDTIARDDTHRAAVQDALLAIRATLADGATVRFGSNAVKDVAGYDMKRLFIGSGNAFGTLHEATLRVTPTPRS